MSIFQLVAMASAVTMVPTAQDQPPQAHVEYQDLNLTSASGQQLLDRRLQSAVNMVCGRTSGQTLQMKAKVRSCQKQALARVAPQRELAIASSGTKIAIVF